MKQNAESEYTTGNTEISKPVPAEEEMRTAYESPEEDEAQAVSKALPEDGKTAPGGARDALEDGKTALEGAKAAPEDGKTAAGSVKAAPEGEKTAEAEEASAGSLHTIDEAVHSIKDSILRIGNRHAADDGKKKQKKADLPLLPKKKVRLTPADPEVGLTDQQVSERIEAGRVNVTEKKGIRSTRQIVVSHTVTYFNIMNLILGVLIFMTGQYKNMLFLGTVICNSVIGIIQELKVRQLISSLSVITAAKATVFRNGADSEIPVEDIVADDIVRVSIGDQIVTDGRILHSDGLEVNESMLTGESRPVRKKEGSRILSGSFVVSGSGTMQADRVGNECYASKLVEKASSKHRASSEMQNAIGRIIKVVSVAIIPIGFLLYRSQRSAALELALKNGYDNQWVFAQSVVHTVSGIIGMIPEGLVLLTSVSFIIGVGRLAYKKALVQEMEAIEALARVNILCTDKTGTITTGELEVERIVPVGGVDSTQINEIIAHMNGAFTDTNVTQEAMNRHFGVVKGWKVAEVVPFSSDRKMKGVHFRTHGSYLIGAPEFLAPDNSSLMRQAERFSGQGFRVLLLVKTDGPAMPPAVRGTTSPLALVVISDVIKEDAKEVFDYFASADVQVKVLSGDNPVTVSAVAVKAGVRGAEKYVDATTLPKNPIALAQEIAKYNVFGRVRPEQKQAFVKAWQTNGKTVAMVGDGVNDVLAIKDADCGIAMANGAEAAKQAAHIVLLDSDFTSMKDIVREGKTIISNIERVSSLYLTKTIYSSVLCLLFILLKTSYPWTTLQMGLINVCGIGLPSFLLTLEKHEDWKTKGFLSHVLKVCLPAAMTMVASILIIQILNAIFKWPDTIYSLFNLMIGALVALLVVGQVSWPLNKYRRIIVIICLVIFAAAILFLPKFYDIHSIWTPWSLLLLPLAVLVMMLIYWFSRFTNRLTERIEKERA